jgi:hypothetical protein
MPLSTNGLQEGDFTTLRVLKNGVLQDVLLLTSAGSPDLPADSIAIPLIAGLQAQLGLKASTAALSAAAEALGGEIDTLDVGVGAVATAVASLGAAVASKAAQSDLVKTDAALSTLTDNLFNATVSLNTNLSTVSAQLETRASTASLSAGLAGKQDLLNDSLTLGGLTISGDGVAFIEHNNGVAFKNSSGQTFGVFEPAGATLGRLVVQGELVAANHYNSVQVDELLGTYAYRLPDGAVGISKIGGLSAILDGKASAEDVTTLTRKYDQKQDLIEEDLTLASGLFRLSGAGGTFAIQRLIDGIYISVLILQYNSATGASRVICPAEFRPGSIGGLQELTIINTITANSAILSNLIVDSASTSVNCNIGNDAGFLVIKDGNQVDSYYQRSQTGNTLFLCRNTRFPVQCGTSLYVGDISFAADAATHQLAVAGKAIISEGLKTTSVDAESLTVNTPSVGTNSVTTADIGSSFSYFRFVHGHHLDCYTRGSNSGRVLYLNYYANSGVRIKSLGINADPASDVNLNVTGSSRFSGTVYAGAVSAGATVINSLDDEIPFIAGNANGFLRVKNGEHIDCYSRATGAGITLNLCMHTDSAVRVGKRLVIATSPTTTYNLDVGGSGRFSGSLSAANFPSSSDARLKTDVEPVSLDECMRLVKAVTPCTYKRIDMEGTPARIGYIAQSWDSQLTAGYRSIMGVGENEDGPLLQLDYSRIVPLLHGALLSALARIEALESRLQ